MNVGTDRIVLFTSLASFCLILSIRFKCCKESSVIEATATPLPTAPEEPVKEEEIAEEEVASEGITGEIEAEEKAASASYKCCAAW